MEIESFYPVREIPVEAKIPVKIPTFLTGKFKDAVIPVYQELTKDNSNFKFYDIYKESARGSNVFIVGGLNKILENSRFRMPVPTDNIYETIFPMIKDNFYTDLNALDMREKKPSYQGDRSIWEQAIKLAEEKQGRVNFPFRIQGFYCVPNKNRKGYSVKITPAKNFKIIEDNRLDLSVGTKFNCLDEIGMIEPDKNGKFTWYSLGNGASGVCLLQGGDLLDSGLVGSLGIGLVVVVDAKGVAPKF